MIQNILLGMGFKGGKGFPDVKMVNGVQKHHMRDKFGNLMYDENGNPIYEICSESKCSHPINGGHKHQKRDKFGNLMYDEFGVPIYESCSET